MGEGVNDAQTYHDHTPICVINSLGITKVTEKKRKKRMASFFPAYVNRVNFWDFVRI